MFNVHYSLLSPHLKYTKAILAIFRIRGWEGLSVVKGPLPQRKEVLVIRYGQKMSLVIDGGNA